MERGGRALLSVYALRLKAAFTAATRAAYTARPPRPRSTRALSLDAPLNDDPDADTLEAVVEDPAGAAAIEEAEAHSDHQQLHGILDHALGALPAEQREVVRRRYYRGQTVAEIATATGVPEKEVRKLEAAAPAGAAASQGIPSAAGVSVKPGESRENPTSIRGHEPRAKPEKIGRLGRP